MAWHTQPRPQPPPDGVFRDDEQRFAIEGTRVAVGCRECGGTGRRRCYECRWKGRDASGEPCPACGGRGEWPCDCGDTDARGALLEYAQVLFRYRQEAQVWHLLPPEALKGGLSRLFRRALDSGRGHAVFEAPTSSQLCEALRAAGVADEETLVTLDQYCRKAQRMASHSRGHVLFQRFQARVAHGATVSVRLGTLFGQVWGVGTGAQHHCTLQHLAARMHRRALSLLPWTMLALLPGLQVSCLIEDGVTLRGILNWYPILLWSYLLRTSSEFAWARRDIGAHLPLGRMLRRSLRSQPTPLVVISGHDPAASGRLFSLIAHLASHAQIADPTQGGVVLDDAWEHLPEMLAEGAEPPEWSATCRLRFGEGVPGPRQVRLLHAVLPDGKPDELAKRVLGRASGLWLVLPAQGTREADIDARQVLLRTGDAPVTVVLDGPPEADPLSGYPGAREALSHRVHRCLPLDLSALRDRYLRGQVSPEEAAHLVRGLIGSDVPDPSDLSRLSDRCDRSAVPVAHPSPEFAHIPHAPASPEPKMRA